MTSLQVRSSKRAMKYEKLLKVEEIDFYSAYYLAKLILLYER